MKIQIISAYHSPRLKYAADFILGQILGFDLLYAQQAETSDEDAIMRIHYGKGFSCAKVRIPAHPFMESSAIEKPAIQVEKVVGLPAFFFCGEGGEVDLPFDIFAMSFYLLSRMEEYGAGVQRDEHGRFPAKASLAYQNGFLGQPLIDQWAWRLYEILRKAYPQCPTRKPNYQLLSTVDIDFAWACLHKGWKRSGLRFFKLLLTMRWKQLATFVKVKAALLPDPFDTYDKMASIHQAHSVQPMYFVLMADYGHYDKNNSPHNAAFHQLLYRLSKEGGIGLHPSYASNTDSALLRKEKKLLEEILSREVTSSRQHFVKLVFPATYQRLLELGIKSDYTMGYADAMGFRASTAHPFYWYDLEREQVTDLHLIPFCAMDVTMKNYLSYTPVRALKEVEDMIALLRQSGGVFCLIWHNSSFSEEMDWIGWEEIYEHIIRKASSSMVE